MANDEPSQSLLQRVADAVDPPLIIMAAAGFAAISQSGVSFIPWVPLLILLLLLIVTGARALRREDQTQLESQERVREAERGLEEALRGPIVVVDSVDHGETRVTDDDEEDLLPDRPSTRPELKAKDDAQVRLTLSELWAVTHRRLDHYHGIALGQARQSFRNAQIAMGLGFALLIAFVIIAFNASTTAGTVVAGGLGAVSAALAGYVSRTFIRSQEAAAGHLRAYFDQPLEFSRYLAAERLMADSGLSEEKRAEVLSLLVQTMIAGHAGPAPADITGQQPGNAP